MTTSVDIQGMQLAQQDFQQALDQMNSVYSSMTEEQDTLSANWSGMAASAFGQALGAWLDDLYQIRQELVVMTESLSVHTGIYSDANEASQQVVTAFHQGLDGLEALPVDGMVAMRHVRGRMLVARHEETVADPLLPNEAERPLLPTLVERRRVQATPLLQGVPAETLEPALPDRPVEPLQPTLRLRAEPALPEETDLRLREEPALPEETNLRLREAPVEPLQPVLSLRERPAEPVVPLQPTLLDLPETS